MSGDLAREIAAACRAALPCGRPLALHEPTIGAAERRSVDACLASGWVSSAGPFVARFEEALCAATAAKHAIATVNGTSALHLALLAAGVGVGDEVLLPALTFVATANAVSYCGAIPNFADIHPQTLGVDAHALDRYLKESAGRGAHGAFNRVTGRPIRAIVVMHTFGHPADLASIAEVADTWCLTLIEDAAESLGSTYRGRHTGTLGRLGTLSFNGNKIVTTGGGGAVLTDDPELAERVRHLSTTARVNERFNFTHDALGYNYRMPSINAALGLAQLEQLQCALAAKRELAARYDRAFRAVAGVRFFVPPQPDTSNHWLNTLILDERHCAQRDRILAMLNDEGIGARPAWTPMHELPMYRGSPRMPLPVVDRLARAIINLPSSPSLVTHATD